MAKLELPAVTFFQGENVNDIFEEWEKECSDCPSIYRDDRDIWIKRSNCRYWMRTIPCTYKDSCIK
jgi:hypothetical protein